MQLLIGHLQAVSLGIWGGGSCKSTYGIGGSRRKCTNADDGEGGYIFVILVRMY